MSNCGVTFALAEAGSAVDTDTGELTVQPYFAPVCRLDNGALAAIEVQLRGPQNGPLASADALKRAARAMDAKRELDALAWGVARINQSVRLPMLVSMDVDSLAALDSATEEQLRRDIVVVTEAALVDSPARTLAAIDKARRDGKVVAVDDVGRRPQSMTLLPLIEPDVIILAGSMVSRRPDLATARTAHAVSAQVERTGAVVVASGVDTALHRTRALGLGATYGVGELYPAAETSEELPADAAEVMPPFPTWSTPAVAAESPYAIASAGKTATRSTKRLLVAMSTSLEMQAAAAGPETLVLGTFQRAEHFTSTTRARWVSMAERISYAGVYGVGMGYVQEGGIMHAPLDPTDPLVEEWNVVVLGPHFCGVLAAIDLHRGEIDADREFDYVMSYDRATVVRCARAILARF
ncbi:MULTISPECIES: EAL domain-containing protein [unclassified Rhodococcus (in: high G+C Gram-positive bacteria)]|uniref:EAL domain-containing protein n=1 Tax=unclassified Rhodococcus (in: high G+C Gram-positive bacteria) TaxID=192944 RepID=UPI000A8DE0E2|nr:MULTISPECIES: EAL domain-containing protein [unclassified Rhodococcus (in: high G+C Gram-positive bacteria)]